MLAAVLLLLPHIGVLGASYRAGSSSRITNSASAACIEACDAAHPVGSADSHPATICGTDFLTYVTTTEAVNDDRCYAVCGISAQYQGSCGCPNDCMASSGYGVCVTESSTCKCAAGWQGADCSLPAVGNACSGHGTLVLGGSTGSAFPFDHCVCDEGYTGTDCTSALFKLGSTPWGTIFSDAQEYTSSDMYKDEHPIWDVARLATIRIEVSEKDYVDLLLPQNLYNESYASATFHFDNGVARQTLYNVGFRVKGASSRMDMKKGWAVKFNEFVSGQKLFDMKKLGLKAGSVSDDTFVKTRLFADFVRAVGVPTQRNSYALLYVNDVYIGLYYMHEDIGPDFMKSRVADDDGKGNSMKYFYNVHLNYFGSDPEYYQTKAHVNELGVPMYYYEQSDGNGDWTDIIDFYYYLNTTSGDAFTSSIEGRIDMSTMLRAMIVESFMLGSDNSASGANYFTYHRSSSSGDASAKNKWVLFDADFDECFAYDVDSNAFEQETDILTYYDYSGSNYGDVSPLYVNTLRTPKFRSTYLQYYKQFMESTFGRDSLQSPTERFDALTAFILPWVERDRFWQVSRGMTAATFLEKAEITLANLPVRYEDVMQQIASYETT